MKKLYKETVIKNNILIYLKKIENVLKFSGYFLIIFSNFDNSKKCYFRKNQNSNGSRPQNPNRYKKPTTTATTTTTTKKNNYAAGGGNNQYGASNDSANAGAYGAGYGDPHFMVSSPGNDPICFDYNPPAGSEMTLIMDPENRFIKKLKNLHRRRLKKKLLYKIWPPKYFFKQRTLYYFKA